MVTLSGGVIPDSGKASSRWLLPVMLPTAQDLLRAEQCRHSSYSRRHEGSEGVTGSHRQGEEHTQKRVLDSYRVLSFVQLFNLASRLFDYTHIDFEVFDLHLRFSLGSSFALMFASFFSILHRRLDDTTIFVGTPMLFLSCAVLDEPRA